MNGLTFATGSDGKWGYKVAGADPVIPFSKGLELLWTNPSLSSSFAPQTVALDLSKYKYIAIKCSFQLFSVAEGHYISTNIIPVPSQVGNIGYSAFIMGINNSHDITSRGISVSVSGVTFGAGDSSSVSGSNEYCIPLKIYGISEELK